MTVESDSLLDYALVSKRVKRSKNQGMRAQGSRDPDGRRRRWVEDESQESSAKSSRWEGGGRGGEEGDVPSSPSSGGASATL